MSVSGARGAGRRAVTMDQKRWPRINAAHAKTASTAAVAQVVGGGAANSK